jgi:hypothetical protein
VPFGGKFDLRTRRRFRRLIADWRPEIVLLSGTGFSLLWTALDAVVLLSGCDKTTPAMLMGAASADVPAELVAMVVK